MRHLQSRGAVTAVAAAMTAVLLAAEPAVAAATLNDYAPVSSASPGTG